MLQRIILVLSFLLILQCYLWSSYNDHNIIISNYTPSNQHNLSTWNNLSLTEIDNQPIRKVEMVFFISMPLAFFLHTLIFETYRHLAVVSAASQGVENASSFYFIREINEIETIGNVLEPFSLFNWLNTIFWAFVITNNFVIETYISKELHHATFRNSIKKQNTYLQLFRHNF